MASGEHSTSHNVHEHSQLPSNQQSSRSSSEINFDETLNSASQNGHEPSSNQQHTNANNSELNAVDVNSCDKKEEEGEVKQQTNSLTYNYEGMLMLPENYVSLDNWSGVYYVYTKNLPWRKIIIQFIQETDKTYTFPLSVYVNDIEFNDDGVVRITCENRSEPTIWHVICWPGEIKKRDDVDKRLIHCDGKSHPLNFLNNIPAVVPNFCITVLKDECPSDTSSSCQLMVIGIKTSPRFDLHTGHHDDLTLYHTIPHQSSVIKAGPKTISSGLKGSNLNTDNTISPYLSQIGLLEKKPEMADLMLIVFPKIKAEWEDVAHILRFDMPTIDSISDKYANDCYKCCRELFKDWLKTGRGVGPKTWSTLLNLIGKLPHLVAATEEIIKDLEAQ